MKEIRNAMHCEKCGKAFTYPVTFKDIMKSQQGKPYVCKKCGKVFTCSGFLQKHERTHSTENSSVYNVGRPRYHMIFLANMTTHREIM
jgi:uncharacterized Zn-finger protein